MTYAMLWDKALHEHFWACCMLDEHEVLLILTTKLNDLLEIFQMKMSFCRISTFETFGFRIIVNMNCLKCIRSHFHP